jgi:GMP synthase (glutamine-hydrolysing)
MEKKEDSFRVTTSDDLEVATYLEIAKELRGEKPIPEKAPEVDREAVVVIDFGSQYSMLIARRVRQCQVYCEILPYDASWQRVTKLKPRGFIFSGGPASVYEPGMPLAPAYVYESHLPILGICYGMQVMAHQLGGKVAQGTKHEYGHAVLHQGDVESPIFADLPLSMPVWMSHGDQIIDMPPGFTILGYTENSPIAVMGNEHGIIGLQFHPEVAHTPQGKEVLRNFLYHICGCSGNWTAGSFIAESVEGIREKVGKGRVITALSGGVDSAVTAALVHRAVGDQLTCIFVNNGLLRREEAERTLNTFQRNLKMNIVYVDASERFLKRLEGVVSGKQRVSQDKDPSQCRRSANQDDPPPHRAPARSLQG